MDIKKIANSVVLFFVNKLIEISGILILILGILLLIALVSFSPEDPNFIFPDNTEIKNLLGFQGSFTSDIFFQSIGQISYLVSISVFFTGLNLFLKKRVTIVIENFFFSIVYILFGTLFLSHFYNESLLLFINGNGGFVGNFLKIYIFNTLITTYSSLFFYLLISFFLIFFLCKTSEGCRLLPSGLKITASVILFFTRNKLRSLLSKCSNNLPFI